MPKALPAHSATEVQFVVSARSAVGEFDMNFKFAVEDNNVLRMLDVRVKGRTPESAR